MVKKISKRPETVIERGLRHIGTSMWVLGLILALVYFFIPLIYHVFFPLVYVPFWTSYLLWLGIIMVWYSQVLRVCVWEKRLFHPTEKQHNEQEAGNDSSEENAGA